MTLTYLFAMNPRPLPQTSEDTHLSIPSAMTQPKPNIEHMPVPVVKPVILEPRLFNPSSPGIAPPTNRTRRTLNLDQDDSSPSFSPPRSDVDDNPSLQTFQTSRPYTPSSPRYMQPLRGSSPSVSRSSSRSRHNTSNDNNGRSTTPNSISSGPSFRPPVSSNQLLSSALNGGSSGPRGNRPSATTVSLDPARTRPRRNLHINTGDHNTSSVSDGGFDVQMDDNIETLRQIQPTPSPKAVPRYMQPKNTTARTSMETKQR